MPLRAAVKAAIFVRSPDLVAYKGTKGRFLTWKKIKKTASKRLFDAVFEQKLLENVWKAVESC